ncbi:septum formation initiator family protein [Actinotalea sp. K2]|uniref:FtsB family cell division protein n=1 Tax=Actinotalea sp. K2 TaxID=2939438 RepID=UPI0020174C1D|nr:septum formation initiator family protein [Actinotalea sp. K2]MCL3861307.1 septum formation initiator family protein [Actinotalea sp. K2]
MSSSRRPSAPRAGAPGRAPAGGPATTTARRPVAPRAGAGPSSGARAPAARPSRTAGPPPAERTRARDGQGPAGDETADTTTFQLARLLSIRALVLAVVLLAAFTLVFPTLRAYLGQRAALAELSAEVTAAEQYQRELQVELERWDDPAFVAAQARDRLRFARPGETAYRVIDPETVVEPVVLPESATGPGAGPALPTGGAVTPWYTTVWDSVVITGESAGTTDGETPGEGAGDPAQGTTEVPDAGGSTTTDEGVGAGDE